MDSGAGIHSFNYFDGYSAFRQNSGSTSAEHEVVFLVISRSKVANVACRRTAC